MKIIILSVSISILVISLFLSSAEAREVSPFDFQLDESAVDGKRYSYVDSGTPHAIIKQGQNVSLPVIILPATNKPVLVKFHATVDYNQTAPPRMSRGVHVIIEPSSVIVKPNQNTTINIVVNVDSNAHPGKYALNIVGEWEAKNGFMGSSIMLHIGRDFGPNAMPFNALWSPLKQYESGIESKDVKCNDGFQLIFKTEDGTPACVKLHTKSQLLKSGWRVESFARTETSFSPKPTNDLEIDLSNQTYEAGYPVYVNLKNINQDSTCTIPSLSVRDMSDQSLVFGPTPMRNYTGHCVDPWYTSFYAGLENNTLITKPTKYVILATLENKTYQKEFTVIPSAYSGKNLTADSTQILPGYLTFTRCLPVNDVPNNGTLINYTGFDLYHRYLAGPDTGGIPEIDDYLLRPGHTGTFVMQVHQGQFSEGANLAGGLYFLSENLINLDNSTVWNNRPLASEAHPGLILSYAPSFAKVGPEGYATITASISALQNAIRGTYWLHLPPGICGGNRVLLTIGDQPLTQPPDFTGYDFASNFVQSVGNPTESYVTFELINAGIHTFENCSVNYVSNNQTTTIKTFDVIPPGMEYKYFAKLTSISKISRFLECKNPPITKVYPDMGFDIIPY